MLAAWQGHEAIVARCIELGADVNASDAVRCSAAHWACIGGRRACLKRLLDAGADPGARMGNGSTPLCEAAYHGHDGCIEELLEQGGPLLDLDAYDNHGDTALHSAGASGSSECTQLLLNAGADPTIRNLAGNTALSAPCSCAWCDEGGYGHLCATVAEPQRARALLKARALIAARRTVRATTLALARKGLPAELQQGICAMAVPAFLDGRVAQGAGPVARVTVHFEALLEAEHGEEAAEVLGAVLGVEGEPGMKQEVWDKLMEFIVPRWDPARKGCPIGEGVFRLS